MKSTNDIIKTYSNNFGSITRMKIQNDPKFIENFDFNNTHKANKNSKVKINGKKVFINIQSFYKENKNNISKNKMTSNTKTRNSSINKENILEKNNANSFYQTKNYLKYNSINSGNKNRQNLTGKTNILVSKKSIKDSSHKIKSSVDKKYNALRSSIDISKEFIRMNSRRKNTRKF